MAKRLKETAPLRHKRRDGRGGAALQDPVAFVRVWAAAALARVAPSGGELVTVLIAELCNELAFVRSLAAWHLGRLGPAFPGIEQAFPPPPTASE